ncbi:indole-3-glycerol phosphate synthase TrpC [Nevskia soli]|uniref:indole-3-glycerol phosphate synthase TrpC n=1 Tax=Nevskia soli TaxID=418856 RepID=UPI0015D6A89A|nr:indole-3-glycerol phosphate synthase TrpC [Nevskia soli]
MTSAIPDVLCRILERKRQEVRAIQTPREALELRGEARVLQRRPFAGALRRSKPAIIAEIKQRSPSKGLFAAAFEPDRMARLYSEGGAAAISVLTDQDFFGGSIEHLETARSSVNLPVLRKDFTIDEIQIAEAAAHGADAILLIAAVLTERELQRFREYAAQFLLAALVEVHDSEELEKAIDSGAAIIGVNNRDLKTFEVRLETSLELATEMPANVIRVSESGIHERAQVKLLTDAGYHAFLVGEHLMRAPDPAAMLRELRVD